MRAITNCRTARLGGHIDVCPACGYIRPSYNSCRNRHCPKCQAFAKERWIENQKYDLLNVAYFHVVFTVPAELHPLFFQCDRAMYNLLFRAVAETLSQLASDREVPGSKDRVYFCFAYLGPESQLSPSYSLYRSGGRPYASYAVEELPKEILHPGKSSVTKISGKVSGAVTADSGYCRHTGSGRHGFLLSQRMGSLLQAAL